MFVWVFLVGFCKICLKLIRFRLWPIYQSSWQHPALGVCAFICACLSIFYLYSTHTKLCVWTPTICSIAGSFCSVKHVCFFPLLSPVYSLLQFLPVGTHDLRSLPLPRLVHGAGVADAGLLSHLDPSYVCDKNAPSSRKIYRGKSSVFF